jgi:hypothetical protein
MLAEELPPSGPGSKRRRRQGMAAKDSANGLVGAAQAELEQFALDPTVPQRLFSKIPSYCDSKQHYL